MITYKYKLYSSKKNNRLNKMLDEACFVWNHALALQKRYYALFKKYIPCNALKKHFAKRIKRTYLHSQTVQEIIERLDIAYNRFFKRIAKRPPKFKRRVDFESFAFKQGGFILNGNTFRINSINTTFKFFLSRQYQGTVKQVRVKRSHLQEYYLCIITDGHSKTYTKAHNGASVGIDFGLKTYLTLSDGNVVTNPQFLKKNLSLLRKSSKGLSRKAKGSNHRKRCKQSLNRVYEYVTNCRKDFQYKLSHDLCRTYDYIFIEDLNLQGMSRLWGRKMNDIAHGEFINILYSVANKYSVTVHKIDKWYPSSKLCDCGYKYDKLSLHERKWICPECGQIHDRDIHAANNILRRGIYELGSGSKTNSTIVEGQTTSFTQESHKL